MSEEPTGESRSEQQRLWMDRARHNAELATVRPEQPVLPKLVGLALALSLVVFVALGFNAFLASFQRVLDVVSEVPEPSTTEPMPVYVVPEAPPPQE